MTRFIMGLLIGLLIGIGGTAAFLISAQGGDYLIVASPRVRELENSLRNADQEREWFRTRLRESNDLLAKLESRFEGLTQRFERVATNAQNPPSSDATSAAAPTPSPSEPPAPAEEPTPSAEQF